MSWAIKSALDSFLFRIFQLIQIQESKLIESRRVNATLIRGEERWLSPAVGPVYWLAAVATARITNMMEPINGDLKIYNLLALFWNYIVRVITAGGSLSLSYYYCQSGRQGSFIRQTIATAPYSKCVCEGVRQDLKKVYIKLTPSFSAAARETHLLAIVASHRVSAAL